MSLIPILFSILQALPWTLFPGMTTADDSTPSDRISVAVVLPLSGNTTASGSSIDFYSGILLGAKTLGDEGINLNINTFDLSTESVSTDGLAKNDIIIGPVDVNDIIDVCRELPDSCFLISPLELKAAGLTDSLPVIQAPTPWQTQAEDLILWMMEERSLRDAVLVVEKSDAARSAYGKFLVDMMDSLGIPYKKLSYAPNDGLLINGEYKKRASHEGITRIFVTSDDEAFVNDVIRNASMLKLEEYNTVLYCPSKVKNFELMDVGYLYNANVRFTSGYMVNYKDPDVKKFILSYRALFKCEPNAFAFQGYDLIRYFVNMVNSFGQDWTDQLRFYRGKGLQTTLQFQGSESTKGLINKAVRRVTYNPDYSITIQ